MKTISVSLSNKCIKEPKCSFCYQNHDKETFDKYDIKNTLRRIFKTEKDSLTVAYEYNGYNLDFIGESLPHSNLEIKETLTTMPLTIDEITVGFMKNNSIKSIALSYDSEKIDTPDDWLYKSLIIKNEGLHLACNYLIEEIPFRIPKSVKKLSDQINLLSLKPNEPLKDKEKRFIKNYLNEIKSFSTEPTLDNALGIQLGYEKECKKGKEFKHIKPDGKIVDCCFQDDCFLY